MAGVASLVVRRVADGAVGADDLAAVVDPAALCAVGAGDVELQFRAAARRDARTRAVCWVGRRGDRRDRQCSPGVGAVLLALALITLGCLTGSLFEPDVVLRTGAPSAAGWFAGDQPLAGVGKEPSASAAG